MITWRMVAAWVAALVLATTLTWQIVGLADSQVGQPPVAVAPSLASSTTGVTVASTGPTSTTPSTPTTTTSSTTPSSSGGTAPPSSSASPDWSVRTINSPGGAVVVRYRPEQVELQAAIPAPGFGVEVDEVGPPRVRVEFENDDDRFQVEARWESGALQVEVDD